MDAHYQRLEYQKSYKRASISLFLEQVEQLKQVIFIKFNFIMKRIIKNATNKLRKKKVIHYKLLGS